jgi:hypothetical protein
VLALETYLDEDLDSVQDLCASFISYSFSEERISKSRNLRKWFRMRGALLLCDESAELQLVRVIEDVFHKSAHPTIQCGCVIM